jgi:hypothetical protein
MNQKKDDIVKFFWLINGVEKLIIAIFSLLLVGAGAYSALKDTLDTTGLVLTQLGILIIAASLMVLLFYNSYKSFVRFMGSKKFKVTGGDNFLKNFSQSFWDGKSIASISLE